MEAQTEKIRGYCNLHGLELIEIFADEGLSGRRSDNRPGLHRALSTICKVRGVLVVLSLSRLARSTTDCIHIAEQLSRSGAELASLSEKIDTTSSIGRFFYSMLAALAQLERDQIAERTLVAMTHLRMQRRRISGVTPYGLDLAADGRSLVLNSFEHKIIEQIEAEREIGHSFNFIARSLNARGIKPKVGVRWYHTTVRSVLATSQKRALKSSER